MIEMSQQAMFACGMTAGVGFGIAAVIRAYFSGRAILIRAQRGEQEPAIARSSLSGLLSRHKNN